MASSSLRPAAGQAGHKRAMPAPELNGPRPRGRVFTPPFVVAAVLLGLAAILTGPVGKALDLRQDKLPLPLRNPLTALRADALRPYSVVNRHFLDPTVVEALGTDQYLYWMLRDGSVPDNDPLANPRLFVTYYSGGRNLVPHVPDECFLGAGYQPAMPHENQELSVPALSREQDPLPVRVCTFARTAVFNREEVTVVYTFASNGRFAATRNLVRLLTNDPRNHHAYFSKVEVHFPGATREQSIRGAAKLLNRVLPVLLSDHWPDFEAAEQSVRHSPLNAGDARRGETKPPYELNNS